MMKKLMVLVAVMAAGSSFACSEKPGYVANGLFARPSFMTSTCGALYKQIADRIEFTSTIRYLEVYYIDPDDTGIAGPFIEKTFKNKGYILSLSRKNGDTYNYAYKKGSKVIIIGLAPLSSLVVLTVTGNN